MHKLDSTQKKIYHKVALEHNLQDKQVHEIMDLFYKFIYDKIKNNNLYELNSIEELEKNKHNFNIMGFGKLMVPNTRFKNKRKSIKNNQ